MSPETRNEVRENLIKAGVKNLNEYGYPSVNPENLMTDVIYRAFFKSMLEDNTGKAGQGVDAVIHELIEEISAAQNVAAE